MFGLYGIYVTFFFCMVQIKIFAVCLVLSKEISGQLSVDQRKRTFSGYLLIDVYDCERVLFYL
jgi:hypothetical protein